MKFLNALLVFIFLAAAALASSPVISGEHSRNLRTIESNSLLYEFHRITTTDANQHFYYPRRDSAWRDSAEQIEKDALLKYGNKRLFLATSVVGGLDCRGGEALADTMFPAVDGGLYIRGFVDSLEFSLDARMYVESHSASYAASYDGEYVDRQSEEESGADYTSYSRYRGHIALNMGFARLDFARDVVHWGPGYYNNLTLNQFAIPFNSITLQIDVGPLTVISLYGDLLIYSSVNKKNQDEKRKLYGHRYELNFGDLVLGMSELQVVYNNNNPWLFVPIVPLFIEKGNYTESSNNGSLSFDVNYRFFKKFRLYSELFIDDFDSPITLIENETAQSKWAWMIGAQTGHTFRFREHVLDVGTLAEYARVEPWVYTHFVKNTAQIAHLGEPLGNQGGPNSQTIDWLVYSRLNQRWQVSLRQTWFWKGTNYGSSLSDDSTKGYHADYKHFLKGAKMEYSLTPALSYDGQFVAFALEWTFIDDRKFYTRFGFKW